MPIGNPVTLTSNVVSKTISDTATASQTLFNVTGGYRINSLGVFKNGSRLQDGVDYIARDGLTVTLLSAASGGDKLQFVVFDTFRVAEAIRPAVDEQTIRGNLNVVGILSCTDLEGPVSLNITAGIQTFHDVRVGGALTVAGELTFEDVTNIDSVGYATFRSGVNVQGAGSTTTTLNVTGVSTFASNVSFAGNVNTGPVLTVTGTEGISANLYLIADDGDDNGDGWRINSNQDDNDLTISNNTTGSYVDKFTLLKTGELTLTNDLTIPDKIVHTGDTNTAIRFPAADTFTVETAGSERVRVDSDGRFLLGTNSNVTGDLVQVKNSAGEGIGFYRNSSANDIVNGRLQFHSSIDITSSIEGGHDGSQSAGSSPGRLVFKTTASGATSPTERLRITSDGKVRVPDNGKFTAGAGDDLEIYHDGSNNYIAATSGSLFIRGSDLVLEDASGNDYITCSDGGAGGTIALKHLGSTKFETKSYGAFLTGNLGFQDNGKLLLGAGDDLQIYHNATDSVITDTSRNLLVRAEGTGDLWLQSDNQVYLGDIGGNEKFIECNDNSDVKLFHDNSEKLATTATGVTVTGTLNATTAVTQNGNALATGGKAIAMALIFG